jgi:hypothetical protein
MKAFVITNSSGKVVGHVRVEEAKSLDAPRPGHPIPPSGGRVHEVDLLPEHLAIKDAAELHRALERHIAKR